MSEIVEANLGDLAGDADAALRQLYACHAGSLHRYVEWFCPDLASTDDIVQETFIRAWRHLPQLAADDRPVRPWLFRVARNLVIDAARAARSRPVTVAAESGLDLGHDDGSDQVMDRQLLAGALQKLSPAHRAVLVETFYRGGTTEMVARQLGIPPGTARSRLHYALHALRQQLQGQQLRAPAQPQPQPQPQAPAQLQPQAPGRPHRQDSARPQRQAPARSQPQQAAA